MNDIVERLRAPLGVMKCEVSTGPAPENKLERRWLLALEAADEIDRLRAALREIKWRSADRDNMEFSATITYSQMDKIRAALQETK